MPTDHDRVFAADSHAWWRRALPVRIIPNKVDEWDGDDGGVCGVDEEHSELFICVREEDISSGAGCKVSICERRSAAVVGWMAKVGRREARKGRRGESALGRILGSFLPCIRN